MLKLHNGSIIICDSTQYTIGTSRCTVLARVENGFQFTTKFVTCMLHEAKNKKLFGVINKK